MSAISRSVSRLCLFGLLPAALTGCQSTHYKAADLPSHLRRSADVSANQIQLSSLASGGGRTTTIGPDDLLAVHVVVGAELDSHEPHVVQVSDDGAVEMPVIGQVRVSGLEVAEASRAIAAAAVERGIYRQPQITVEMHKQASNRVVVLGAVGAPGAYDLPRSGSDVASAIAAAGGLTDVAGPEVEVLRQSRSGLITAAKKTPPNTEVGDEVTQVAYEAVANDRPLTERINLAQAGAAGGGNQRLDDRDVVMVHPKDKRVIHVTGLVERPDQFELPDDQPIRVLDALALAGGVSSPVADRVYVIRPEAEGPGAQPVVIELSISKAKHVGNENLVLGPGDLVSVEQTVATTVIDTMRDFFRITMGVSSRLTAF